MPDARMQVWYGSGHTVALFGVPVPFTETQCRRGTRKRELLKDYLTLFPWSYSPFLAVS